MIELLVVFAIIAILTAIIVPVSQSVLDQGRKAACISNLRQIGAGIAAYANDHDGDIPYGPKAPPYTSPANLYPSTGSPTSLLSLRSGEPAALGLLLDHYLAKTPKVFFCPVCDQPQDADLELSPVGTTQTQSSYYDRHGGNTQLFDNARAPHIPQLKLANLGTNRNGVPIRALVIDTMFLCPADLDAFNVKPRTCHRYSVDVSDSSQLRSSFDKILQVFERADVL